MVNMIKVQEYNLKIMIQHIIPIKDLKEHVDVGCECNPRLDILENGDILLIHNSYDGREGLELANEILNQKKL